VTPNRVSAALTGDVDRQLRAHLLREDGQEDVCLATYRPSTGVERATALIDRVVLPKPDERLVHGNASFTTPYLLRAAQVAADSEDGVVILHSHPASHSWQQMSPTDARTEATYANLTREITGLPLVGMTLAHDTAWSCRWWNLGVGRAVAPTHAENVRVLRDHRLIVSWNDQVRQPPTPQPTQVRTTHCWGDATQADLARLRVLVVGAGSVGLTVAVALAATGIEHVAVMDHDTVKIINLDRLLGATPLDAFLHRAKAQLALRLIADASTAERPVPDAWEHSVCEPAGFAQLLDFDLVFSCVDRPWPRHVLNTAAYADLIPVIDGGIHVDPHPRGGMRGAIWRSHVTGPYHPCLVCNGQYQPWDVALEQDGSLDNPTYIARLPTEHPLATRQNVSILSVNCAAALLAQFLSLVVAPGGVGDPGPLRYHLAPHYLQHESTSCIPNCPYPAMIGAGDHRPDPTARHRAAERERHERATAARRPSVRAARIFERASAATHRAMNKRATRRHRSR